MFLRFLAFTSITAVSLLAAQAPTTVRPVISQTPEIVAGSGSTGIPAISNAPFSATEVRDIIRTAADGTLSTSQTIALLARDSNGRTYVERHSAQGDIRFVLIGDPVAHTRTVLNPAKMEASVATLSGGVQPSVQPFQLPAGAEDLGVSSMEGLTVHGFRRSSQMAIVEGAVGRNQVTGHEEWYSDQLGVEITAKTTFAGGQVDSVNLTHIRLGEPEASLFHLPAGYTVAKTTEPQGAVHIGGQVAEANLITRVEPVYPELAKQARVSGTVEFSAVIGTDGGVTNLQLVRGHPLLVNAAKEAVLQWKYRPTLLNGNAVSVVTPITVTFSLP